MKNTEQLEEWFEKYESQDLKFEDLENKPHECKQVSAILFLGSKLKNPKKERWFLHGEHDMLYIGSGFDVFNDFTEEDARIAVAHDIGFADDGDGFQIYASM